MTVGVKVVRNEWIRSYTRAEDCPAGRCKESVMGGESDEIRSQKSEKRRGRSCVAWEGKVLEGEPWGGFGEKYGLIYLDFA
jgi:hypothetical protein